MPQPARKRESDSHRGGRPPRARGGWPLRAGMAAAVAFSAAMTGCAAPAAGHPAAAGTPRRTASPPAFQPAATRTMVSPSPTITPRPDGGPTVLPVPPGQGHLPQTQALPSSHTAGFHAEMTDLWAAVVTGKAALAAQAFFPLPAYTQIKAIYDPAADWHGRLFADFSLDVAAAHRYLEPGAARARLVQVIVPAGEAAWIPPGVCANSGGYWHVGGARLVYRQDGQLRSIGIASLISWRGRWYVVHFGAVLRGAVVGIVDTPSAGPGVPGPPGGC